MSVNHIRNICIFFKICRREEKYLEMQCDDCTVCLLVMLPVRYRLKAYSAERKGERDEMQDAHVIQEDFTKEFSSLDPSM